MYYLYFKKETTCVHNYVLFVCLFMFLMSVFSIIFHKHNNKNLKSWEFEGLVQYLSCYEACALLDRDLWSYLDFTFYICSSCSFCPWYFLVLFFFQCIMNTRKCICISVMFSYLKLCIIHIIGRYSIWDILCIIVCYFHFKWVITVYVTPAQWATVCYRSVIKDSDRNVQCYSCKQNIRNKSKNNLGQIMR